jgi:carboxymethylenebutenolidase
MKTTLVSTFIAMLLSMTASGQDWAKARLDKSPRHMEWVKIKRGDRTLNCFVVYPEVRDKATAVLVIHEIFGLTDWARATADELAEAGYIAIAPDLLSGRAPGGGGTAELGGNDAAVKAVSALPPDQVTADLNAAADYVVKLPAANGNLVVAGFCWGGGQSFRYATQNKNIRAAFVFYGPPPPAEAMTRIQCPVYGFYGGNDNRVTSTVSKASEDMKQAGKTYEPVTYPGAGHGFMRAGEAPEARPADKKARDDAWERWKKLLQKI